MTAPDAVQERVRRFVMEHFPLARERGVGDEDSLLDDGIIDSLGTLELVAFLEREFDIVVDDEDMVADHFESIASIAAFAAAREPA